MNLKNHWILFFLMLPNLVNAQIDRPGAQKIPAEEKVQRDLNHRVFYEIFVRSFYDSNDDGIGDLNGITSQLDYLATLGITGLWVTPFHPSPSYHKYDVLDYLGVDQQYGTLDDFKILVTEAHKRNILVLLDLVANHTAYDHPWFKASINNDPVFKQYYLWETSPPAADKNWYLPRETNGFNTNEKYYGFFSRVMPDLNFDNPAVRQSIIDVGKWWLKETSVDGFRLDAAQHIYTAEDTAANNNWWKQFTDALKKEKPDVITIGEVWSKKNLVATYAASLSGAFNFELSWDLLKILQDEKNDQLIEKLLETKKLYAGFSPFYSDPIFLSNHDGNRIMSDLKDNVEKAKLAAAIYLTLPGTPFIYYGEELGMRGMKPDEWIREPFLWDRKKRDQGQTHWEKAKYSTGKKVKSLAQQKKDPASVYNCYLKLINARRINHSLTSVQLKPVASAPATSLVYERGENDNRILVIHNLAGSPLEYVIPGEFTSFRNVVYQSAPKITVSATAVTLPAYGSILLSVK